MTLIFDKLLAVWKDSGKIGQLRQTRSFVMNNSWVASISFKSIHQRLDLAVVTDACYVVFNRVLDHLKLKLKTG